MPWCFVFLIVVTSIIKLKNKIVFLLQLNLNIFVVVGKKSEMSKRTLSVLIFTSRKGKISEFVNSLNNTKKNAFFILGS